MPSTQKSTSWKKIYAALPFVCKYCNGLFSDFKFYQRHIRSHESRYKKFWFSRKWRVARRLSMPCIEDTDMPCRQKQDDGAMIVSDIIKYARRHSCSSQADSASKERPGKVNNKVSRNVLIGITLEQAALIAHYQRMQLSNHEESEFYSDSEDCSDSNSYHNTAFHGIEAMSDQLEQCRCSECFRQNKQALEEPMYKYQQPKQKNKSTGTEMMPNNSQDFKGPVMLPCPHCPVSFDRDDQLALHIKNHYTGNMSRDTLHAAECDTDMTDESKHDLKQFSNSHARVNSPPLDAIFPPQCQGNGNANKSNNNGNFSKLSTAADSIIKRQELDEHFPCETDLKVHQKYHEIIRGYRSVAKKHLKKMLEHDESQMLYSSLKTCKPTHIGKKVCEKINKPCSDFKLHKIGQLEPNIFTCKKCNAMFKHRSSLTAHDKARHTEDCKNICPVCQKKFSMGSNLRDHLRIHTGERPYQCASCGRGFTQKSHLRKHVMIHTGERPFKCSYCNKGFTQRGDVRRHEKIHRKIKLGC